MICCLCGRQLKRAASYSAGGALGPKCARKTFSSPLFTAPFDLNRACEEAQQRIDAFIFQRANDIRRQLEIA